MRKKKRYFSRATCFILCAVFALLFLLPTVLTITNSFMTQSEITASYGQVFENANDGKSYIFRLRDGTWPDGSPITGETARAALRRAP